MDNGRLNILAEMKTDKGGSGIISIELNTVKDINSKYSKYNLVVSAFSAKDNYVRNLLQKRAERVEYIKKDLSQVNHQLHESLAIFNERSNVRQATSPSSNAEALNSTSETLPRIKPVSTNSISQNRENVNTESQNGVVVKTKTGAASNITVQNCEIMSLANNFKIGTETGFDVSGVSVSSCYFFTAECAGGYAGIAIESADGAHISEVSVSDIVMDNVTSPLLIWLGCRLDEEYGAKNTMGAIDGVTIENIDANNIDLPCAVVGCEYDGRRYKVKNASVRNVKAVYRDCYEDLHIYRGDKVLEANMDGYPEITRVSHRYFISHALSAYYDLPVYGIYVRDVENFVLENFSVTPRQGNTRALTNFSA